MIKHTWFARLTLDKLGISISDEMINDYFVRELSSAIQEKMQVSVVEETPTSISFISEVVVLSRPELEKLIEEARTKGMEDFAEMIKKINGA